MCSFTLEQMAKKHWSLVILMVIISIQQDTLKLSNNIISYANAGIRETNQLQIYRGSIKSAWNRISLYNCKASKYMYLL